MSSNRNVSNIAWFAIPVMLIAIAAMFAMPVVAPGALERFHLFASRTFGSADSEGRESAALLLLIALAFLCLAGLFAAYGRQRGEERRRRRIAPYFSELLTLADRAEGVDDTESLAEIAGLMMASYRRAERDWLAGNLATEHMTNLYAAHHLRFDHITSRTGQIQIRKLREQSARIYALMASHIRHQREAAAQLTAKRTETQPAPAPKPAASAKPAAAKPEPSKTPPATVTATVVETEEALPDILLPPDESRPG